MTDRIKSKKTAKLTAGKRLLRGLQHLDEFLKVAWAMMAIIVSIMMLFGIMAIVCLLWSMVNGTFGPVIATVWTVGACVTVLAVITLIRAWFIGAEGGTDE